MSEARVLFLCTGNSARSQMAEALLRHAGGERFEAYSAGTEPKDVHPLAVAAMAELGIDISGQRAKSVAEFLGWPPFAFLITVCDDAAANCPAFPGAGERLHWSLKDPAAAEGSEAERLMAFRHERDNLAKGIATFVREH